MVAAEEFVVDQNGNQVPLCSGGILVAVAAPLALDQFYRPIFGFTNLYLTTISSSPELVAAAICAHSWRQRGAVPMIQYSHHHRSTKVRQEHPVRNLYFELVL